MADRKPALGYVGLGLMGLPMALRLLAAGYPVAVWNRAPAKTDAAVGKGATRARSPAALAAASDIVFTCVTDDRAVAEVVFGPGGVAEAASPAKLLVDFSTIKPAAAQAMAARLRDQTGMRWIDAPVTGGRAGAIDGTLVVMAGGEAADIEAVRPVVAHLSQRFVHIGRQGSGLVTKLCNQVAIGCGQVVLAEMLTLARAGGIDGGRLPAVLEGGSADSRLMQVQLPRMAARDFTPQGHARTTLKDLDIIGEFAEACGAALPLTRLATELWRLHVARGDGELDSVSIVKLFDPGAG